MRKIILAAVAVLAMLAATTATASATTVFESQNPETGIACDVEECPPIELDGTFTYGTHYDCAISAHATYSGRISDTKVEYVVADPGLTDDGDVGNGDDCNRKPCDTGSYEHPWSMTFQHIPAAGQFPARVYATLAICGENSSGQQFTSNQAMILESPGSGAWTYESFDWLSGSPASAALDAQGDSDVAFALVDIE